MMPGGPESFFVEQCERLERFLVDQDRVLLRVLVDPELRRMPLNYLASREDASDFPHLVLGFDAIFRQPYLWFGDLLALLEQEVSAQEDVLTELGAASDPPQLHPDREARVWETFLARAERLTDSLPDHVGSLVFLLEPEEVHDERSWQSSMRFLADHTGSPWLKFVVLEPRLKPLLESLADHPKVASQVFWMSPEEIERRADAILAASDPGPT